MTGISLLTRLLLLRPRRVAAHLELAHRAGVVATKPNLWQVALGVLRMSHRILFRSETIGLCRDLQPRSGWRARLLRFRPLRLPLLLWEGSVAPWDLSGLVSSPARLERHLLGTHHDRLQFVYDLQLLVPHAGRLEALRDAARDVVEARRPRRAAWLRDLCVYEGYHERLLDTLEGVLEGRDDLLAAHDDDPDVSFVAQMAWCAGQPQTPKATWAAWRRGDYHPERGLRGGPTWA